MAQKKKTWKLAINADITIEEIYSALKQGLGIAPGEATAEDVTLISDYLRQAANKAIHEALEQWTAEATNSIPALKRRAEVLLQKAGMQTGEYFVSVKGETGRQEIDINIWQNMKSEEWKLDVARRLAPDFHIIIFRRPADQSVYSISAYMPGRTWWGAEYQPGIEEMPFDEQMAEELLNRALERQAQEKRTEVTQ